MIITLKGIVLNTIRYKDNSFICRIFTEHYGLKTFIVQSGKTAKTAKSHLLQPMMLVEFETTIKENVQINRLRDLRIAIPLAEAYYHPVKSAMLIFLNEVLFKTLPDEYVNDKLYQFLWEAVQLLDDAIDARNFHIWCLMEISRFYGFYPYIEDEEPQYFDLQTAAFSIKRPHHLHLLEGENCLSLLALLDKQWLQVQPIELHSTIRKALLEAMVTFLKLHLENLREIKSLAVLHEVFH